MLFLFAFVTFLAKFRIVKNLFLETGSMNIANSEINITSVRDTEIRLKAFDFEKKLQEYFTLPQIIPVPDDFHPEVPRIIFSTPRGHSTLTISQINFSFKTSYDGEFTANIDKCIEYLKERMTLVFSTLKESNIVVFYMGLIFNFEDLFTQNDDPVIALSRRFLSDHLGFTEELHDINLKLTTCHDNLFYKNITFTNYRRYKKKSIPKPSPAFLELEGEGLQVQLDINDRLAFNTQKDYESSEKVLPRLFEMVKEAYLEIPQITGVPDAD